MVRGQLLQVVDQTTVAVAVATVATTAARGGKFRQSRWVIPPRTVHPVVLFQRTSPCVTSGLFWRHVF